jgi:hypothetical protein
MTNDGKNIYQSDGTENFDYKTQKTKSYLAINANSGMLK